MTKLVLAIVSFSVSAAITANAHAAFPVIPSGGSHSVNVTKEIPPICTAVLTKSTAEWSFTDTTVPDNDKATIEITTNFLSNIHMSFNDTWNDSSSWAFSFGKTPVLGSNYSWTVEHNKALAGYQGKATTTNINSSASTMVSALDWSHIGTLTAHITPNWFQSSTELHGGRLDVDTTITVSCQQVGSPS